MRRGLWRGAALSVAIGMLAAVAAPPLAAVADAEEPAVEAVGAAEPSDGPWGRGAAAAVAALPLGSASDAAPTASRHYRDVVADEPAPGEYTWKEVLFVSASCLGKASIQAALGAVAVDRVAARFGLDAPPLLPPANGTAADAAAWAAHDAAFADAVTVRDLASLSALFFAPLAALLLNLLGPHCLRRW